MLLNGLLGDKSDLVWVGRSRIICEDSFRIVFNRGWPCLRQRLRRGRPDEFIMRVFVRMVGLMGLFVIGLGGEVLGAALSLEPVEGSFRVLLRGEGRAELAPHGMGNIYAPVP